MQIDVRAVLFLLVTVLATGAIASVVRLHHASDSAATDVSVANLPNASDPAAAVPIDSNVAHQLNTNASALQESSINKRQSCAPITYDFDSASDLIALTDSNFDNNFCSENARIADGNLVLRLTPECGPSIGPTYEFREGKVEARIRTGRTSGVVTSLYLRSGVGPDGNQDEIDIEFVGKDPSRFQTFFWVNGKRGQSGPVYHDVGQDTSADYHVYGVDYRADSISWQLDGETVRTLRRSEAEIFPDQPQRFKVTLWDGSSYDDWAGKSDKSQFPQYAYFDWIKFTPHC
ncbi:concanavalin A-like lectin/glucanase domain-containing protein [Thamnocephalis sphaerospora]|uniref:Concanavalin A-like lectin/glucanase domain-containing protein n=1 Tax=Thamnocephalis sphaerospora TaxID=78915 RepID=A0A4P9XHS1_9FUNG|nr:concanavalin A-like lectin/glucanase domain-containing protein [Thamnocephalis sphaerospora]|eukprot:RKP05232.1 concanavalin A-like lectin/glucanase domain-containing protein [Thamnocephalis sphaerospora]